MRYVLNAVEITFRLNEVFHSRLIEPFLPFDDWPEAAARAKAVSQSLTLALEFFLEPAGETGEMFGMTNGCWMSEVKVRKAIVDCCL